MNMKTILTVFAILFVIAACAPQAPITTPAAQPAQVATQPPAPAAQPPVPASGPVPEEAPVQQSASQAAPATAKTVDVDIKGFAFSPSTITINKGDTVRWTNKDSAPHTATADDNTFTTPTLKTGDSGQITFDKPGTYAYHCAVHPSMKATIVVQ